VVAFKAHHPACTPSISQATPTKQKQISNFQTQMRTTTQNKKFGFKTGWRGKVKSALGF
jgi:hypothetical protein